MERTLISKEDLVMEDKDTIIVTNAKKQNNGRMLVIGGALAILAGMFIIDRHSDNYTATDAEDKKKFRELHDSLENGVED